MSFGVRPRVQLVHGIDKLKQNLPKLRGIAIYKLQGMLLLFFFVNYLGSHKMELEVFKEVA